MLTVLPGRAIKRQFYPQTDFYLARPRAIADPHFSVHPSLRFHGSLTRLSSDDSSALPNLPFSGRASWLWIHSFQSVINLTILTKIGNPLHFSFHPPWGHRPCANFGLPFGCTAAKLGNRGHHLLSPTLAPSPSASSRSRSVTRAAAKHRVNRPSHATTRLSSFWGIIVESRSNSMTSTSESQGCQPYFEYSSIKVIK